ncbi:MAG: MOSC domain-containing protein [Candidatus Promineifilaceae bacterium]|nr:MOSC domain-containing protein [Candidatus Promineifilaceae bacterium]
MPSIFSIVYQPKHKKYTAGHFADFIRDPLNEANLIANHGIEGDAKAGKQPSRQLNILSLEWLQKLENQGFKTGPGEFGEQIIIQDLDVDALDQGERLQIGQQALVEITGPRHACSRLEAAQGLSNDIFGAIAGRMAKVITSGTIKVGDEVKLV